MKKQNSDSKSTISALISEYEAMSHQGTVGFIEEKVFFQLTAYYQREKQLEKAIEVIDHALSQYPYSSEFYILKAELLLELAQPTEASYCLDRAEIYSPAELEIQLLRAEVLVALGDTDQAFVLLDAITDGASLLEQSEIHLCRACIYEHIEDFKAMFHSLKAALLTNPKNRLALERLWLSVELSQLYSESIDLHQRLIDIDPYSFIAWYNLGHAYSCVGDFESAAEAFEYAYLIDETFEFAYRDCAEAWIQLQRHDKALQCFEDAMDHFAPDADMLLKLGQCHIELGNYEQAKLHLLQAIEIEPTNDDVYFRIGQCFMHEEHWYSAIKALSKAVKINDRREEYLLALAQSYARVAEPEKALVLFRQATDTAPEQSQHWLQYASCLLDNGKAEKALLVLDEGMSYAPSNDLLYGQVACLFSLGRRKEGLYLFGDALRNNYARHQWLFDRMPELKSDQDIQLVFSTFLYDGGRQASSSN
ncbi:MAG: tetratricopeptide repeat protein [Bacteroidota bacterium]